MEEEFAKYLERVRAHRAELRDSMTAVDEALGAPIESAEWRDRVRAAVAELAHDFRTHVELTEGEGGLYADVRASSPRLSGKVRRLMGEHTRYAVHLQSLLAHIDGEGELADPAALREEVTALVGQLVRHRQAGSDLVFEAYEVDIGGSG